jgi:hypothetical protein
MQLLGDGLVPIFREALDEGRCSKPSRRRETELVNPQPVAHESQPEQEQAFSKSGEGILANQSNNILDVEPSAQNMIERLILSRTLGMGGRSDDPFRCFPLQLSPHSQAALDHCKLPHLTLDFNM